MEAIGDTRGPGARVRDAQSAARDQDIPSVQTSTGPCHRFAAQHGRQALFAPIERRKC